MNEQREKFDLQKIIRILTLPSLMALLEIVIFRIAAPEYFKNGADLIVYLGSLGFLPLLSYALQPVIPGFRGKGRRGQRNLAMLASVIGYTIVFVYACIAKVSEPLFVIALTYFLSGILILFFNKGIKIRASGHASGVTGPIAVLSYYLGPIMLLGTLLLPFVYRASLVMKRHTMRELLFGSMIPLFAFLCAKVILWI